MIEIILREDVSNYETKPLFGFTYRQAGAVAVTAIFAYIIWVGATAIGIPIPIIGLVIVAVGVVVAACFLVKIQGMYANKRLPILLDYRHRPQTKFSQNAVYKSEELEVVKSKKEKREEEKLIKQAEKETEFYTKLGIDESGYEFGECVTQKQRVKELRAKGVVVVEPKQKKKQIKQAKKELKKAEKKQDKQNKKASKKKAG